MICKVCGTENESGSKFCVSCGAVLEQPAPAPEVFEQPYAQQPYADPIPAPVYEEPSLPGKVFGIIGMVLGICSLVFCWVPFFGMILGIAGLILSIIGKSKASKAGRTNGMAIAGIICSAIGLGIGFIINIIWIVAIIETAERASRYSSYSYYSYY